VVEAELFLELLVGLLTNPPGLDRRGEHLDCDVGRQVRHIVFLLSSRPLLADEPNFIARHALHTVIEHPVFVAIRNADAASREETCQPPFRAPAPADLLPFRSGQRRFSGDRGLIGDMVFAGLAGFRDGENQSNIGGIDILASRHPYCPQQTALVQSLTKRPAGAVP